MPTTLNLYDKFRENQFDGNGINFDTPTGNGIKCAILAAAHTVNQATHEFWSDVSANEVAAGTGYTAGGNVCAAPSAAIVSTDVVIDMTDPATWTQDLTGFTTGRYIVFYHDTGTPATSKLIGYGDYGSNFSIQTGPITITLSASGLFTSPR